MENNVKKTMLIVTVLLGVFLLSSCTWKDQDKVANVALENDNVIADSKEAMQNETTNHSGNMDNMKEGEWTEEEMAEMKGGEWEHWMMDDDKMMKNEKSWMKTSWVYEEYSSEKLVNAKWNIVLFFAASWCPSCNSSDKNFKSETVPDGLTILKLDYDTNTDLKKKYWITSQHSFVQVDNKWEMIKKWLWSRDIEDVIKKVK